jgi:hypothetical protein
MHLFRKLCIGDTAIFLQCSKNAAVCCVKFHGFEDFFGCWWVSIHILAQPSARYSLKTNFLCRFCGRLIGTGRAGDAPEKAALRECDT